jgi:hypothetical protein
MGKCIDKYLLLVDGAENVGLTVITDNFPRSGNFALCELPGSHLQLFPLFSHLLAWRREDCGPREVSPPFMCRPPAENEPGVKLLWTMPVHVLLQEVAHEACFGDVIDQESVTP